MASLIETLMRLNAGNLPPVPAPAPSMPLGVATPPLAGPTLGAPPDIPPVAPLPAPDANFINQFAGAPPVAPTVSEPNFIDRLAAVLGGIAGGPRFAEGIREERDRPIREYQQQLERFQNRRSQGVEIDERRREREQDRATRTAEAKAEREFQQFIRRANFTDEQAILQARQAFELNKLREQERIQDERDAARAAAETEKQRRSIENDLASKDGAPSNIAKEISEWRVGLRPELSAAAQKWQGLQARKAEAQLARLSRIGAGGGGSERVMVDIVGQDGAVLGRIPYSQVKFQDGTIAGFPGATLRFPQAQPPSGLSGVSPTGIPLALGSPGGPQPSVETLPGGIRMTTPAPTMKRSTAKAKLVKGGFTPAEADAELDRLGIK